MICDNFFQFSEDNMEWSVSAGCPVITGGWNVQVVIPVSRGFMPLNIFELPKERKIEKRSFTTRKSIFLKDLEMQYILKKVFLF